MSEPLDGRRPGTVVGAAAGPLPHQAMVSSSAARGSTGSGAGCGGVPGEDEGHAVAGGHGERGDGGHVLAVDLDGVSSTRRVGPPSAEMRPSSMRRTQGTIEP